MRGDEKRMTVGGKFKLMILDFMIRVRSLCEFWCVCVYLAKKFQGVSSLKGKPGRVILTNVGCGDFRIIFHGHAMAL
jgi:hypothetical protein